MSTRDELENDRAELEGALSLHENIVFEGRHVIVGSVEDIAETVIAEGWRKKPSRDEVARAIAWGVDGVDGEQFDDAAVDYRLEMLQGADAVLALMDGGQ